MLKGFNYASRSETCNCIFEVLAWNKDGGGWNMISDGSDENLLRVGTGGKIRTRLNTKLESTGNSLWYGINIDDIGITSLGYRVKNTKWRPIIGDAKAPLIFRKIIAKFTIINSRNMLSN